LALLTREEGGKEKERRDGKTWKKKRINLSDKEYSRQEESTTSGFRRELFPKAKEEGC